MKEDASDDWVYIRPDLPQRLTYDQAARTVSVWLLPKFSMLALFCLLEPLRVANRFGRALFAWELLSVDGQPVTASNGVTLSVDGATDGLPRGEMLAVVSSYEAEVAVGDEHLAWLRRVAAQGKLICGLETAAFVMARAGVLAGHRVALHWESVPAFQEEFPGLEISPARYVFDGARLTGSGGTTSLDMMLDWLEQMHGTTLSASVARQLMHRRQSAEPEPGEDATIQRNTSPTAVAKALAIMEATVDSPLPLATLGQRVGKSPRQLTRLFKTHVGQSPQRHYLTIRLDHAQRILAESRLSVTQTAVATGFEHLAHFSRVYTARFGESPRQTARRGTRASPSG
ncbi:GlxA family transcriptional regulator [Salinisphaera sp. SPP-AMP-43]|uniref:GlxA family transcriptional regulator n=1 Tax=Salinisphaera sp. SPP-AMP-43 TaxID=3121288 RepID=UPI003C6E3500